MAAKLVSNKNYIDGSTMKLRRIQKQLSNSNRCKKTKSNEKKKIQFLRSIRKMR